MTTNKIQAEEKKEWFCRHCKKEFSGVILYCPECHSPDALIKDEFSFRCGYEQALKEMINVMLEKKGDYHRMSSW